jgi:hypothetical protein
MELATLKQFDFSFFCYLITLFNQFLTSFFCRLWYSKADYLPIVFRCYTHIRVHNCLFYIFYLFFIPRADGNSTRIRGGNIRYLI